MVIRKSSFTFVILLCFITALVFGIHFNSGTNVGGPLASPLPRFTATFIDVGQGDAMLIRTPAGRRMLIDAGTHESADAVCAAIDRSGGAKLDVVIGTHPHEDHIGGLPTVIRRYGIGRLYLPKAAATTRTFEELLQAVKAGGLKITPAKAGIHFNLDPNTQVDLLAPNGSTYEDLNNYSVVTKITYRKTTLLLTGDAESLSEREMLQHGAPLHADLLKVGHHGSRSSTSQEFLNQVAPKIAVISLGKNNSYHHPHPTTLTKLRKMGIAIYRTDQDGTVTVTSDGQKLTVQTTKGVKTY